MKPLWLIILIIGLALPARSAPQHPFIKIDAPPAQVLQIASQPVSAQEPVSDYLAYIVPDRRFDAGYSIVVLGYSAASAADIVTTKGAIERGGFESNPDYALNGGRQVNYAKYIAASLAKLAVLTLAEKFGPRWVRAICRVYLIISTGRRFNAAYSNYQFGR